MQSIAGQVEGKRRRLGTTARRGREPPCGSIRPLQYVGELPTCPARGRRSLPGTAGKPTVRGTGGGINHFAGFQDRCIWPLRGWWPRPFDLGQPTRAANGSRMQYQALRGRYAPSPACFFRHISGEFCTRRPLDLRFERHLTRGERTCRNTKF